MKLKPYQPIPKHRTDLLTYAVRFLCGCILGFFIGLYFAFRSNPHTARLIAEEGTTQYSSTFVLTVVCITIFTGLLAAIFGDRFWRMFS